LIQFSEILNRIKNNKDILARWGGEEFLWLVQKSEGTDIIERCNAFQKALHQSEWPEGIREVTCSIGFSPFPLIEIKFEDWESSLRLADYGLYQAKSSGKNQWYGFELLDTNIAYEEIINPDTLLKSNRVRILTTDNKNK